jgi:FKBP-type peptidyl-prolyl cis-trans isomerase
MFTRPRGLLVAAVPFVLLVAACGDSAKPGSDGSSTTVASSKTTAAGTATTAAAGPKTEKPVVKIPASLPTKLVITDLVEGTGTAAVTGDVVTVNYVGVRSADGKEFDNSYDRGGEGFPVPLGAGQVIKGWDQGLVGVKVGGRRQLDIPADLAYGNSPKGDIIKAGDALTFVVDVVSVKPGLPATIAADEPKDTIAGGPNVTKADTKDLVEGKGAVVKAGDELAVHIKAIRADTGAVINSSWTEPTATSVVANPTETIPALANGIIGMKVGGRRQLLIPFNDAFGSEGNPNLGLPPSVDLILIVDVIAIR